MCNKTLVFYTVLAVHGDVTRSVGKVHCIRVAGTACPAGRSKQGLDTECLEIYTLLKRARG